MDEPTKERQTSEGKFLQSSVNFFHFEIDSKIVSLIRDSLPSVPTIASIGCGSVPNEPAQLANLLGRDISYFGHDINEDKIQSAQKWAELGSYQRGTGFYITTKFVVDDLTLQANREEADVIFFNQPDVLGAQESDWLTSLEQQSEIWIEIFHNSLNMLKRGGKVIVIYFTEEEETLIRDYLAKGGINKFYSGVNDERMKIIVGQKQ